MALVNGTRLLYATSKDGPYTEIKGVEHLPPVSGNPNKIRHAIINAEIVHYELGQKDPGDVQYKVSCGDDEEIDTYFAFVELEKSGATVYFKDISKTGVQAAFSGTVAASYRPDGSDPDGILSWALTIGLRSDFEMSRVDDAQG